MMTKTKQQLRAEAVERLNGMVLGTGSAVKKLAIALGVKWNPDNSPLSMSVLQNTLTDLLTDDCDTECYECARLAELTAENSALRVKVDEPTDGGGDYVSREAYEDLRDEFVWETTFLHRIAKKCGTKDVPSLVAYVEQLEAKVAEHEAVDRRMAPHDRGHIADMSQKSADCVRNDGEMSEIDANDGNATCNNSGVFVTDDSREKLEADANGYVLSWWHSGWVDSFTHANSMKRDIMRLLDRQASITERHILTHPDERDEQIAELQTRVDELERENAKLQAGYDAIISKCAALCTFCWFSMVDAAGEVI